MLKPLESPTNNWQDILACAIRDPEILFERLALPKSLLRSAKQATTLFPLLVPPLYLSRIESGNPNDPLLRQILPLQDEFLDNSSFSQDPVGDSLARLSPGVLQKYNGRALLVLTGACAVHCRYCFRRHYPYTEDQWRGDLSAIENDSSISEVILSGGDPLLFSDDKLKTLFLALEAIPHVRRLRIHSRIPTLIPERITHTFIDLVTQMRLTPFLVLHVNHPRELGEDNTDPVGLALLQLRKSGVSLLNQSVLLRGVNDDAETLIALSRRLVDLGVIPYYLHQLDRVQGGSHFEVSESRGATLMRQLLEALPGYAVPKYVREVPGKPYKIAIPISERPRQTKIHHRAEMLA